MMGSGNLSRRDCIVLALVSPLARAAGGRVRVGCQTRAYGSPLRDFAKLLSALEDLIALGYEGFETNSASLEKSFADPAPARKEIEQRGVPLIGLHVGAVTQVIEVARAVKAFGGSQVVLSGSRLPAGPDGTPSAEALEKRVADLNRAGKSCRELGITLCAHNHRAELEHGAKELRTVLAGTDPGLISMILDVGNPFPADFTPVDILRAHSRRIAGFHLRDTVNGNEVVFGKGEFAFDALARAIRETGWCGWLIAEVNLNQEIPSRQMVEMIRRHIRKNMGY
jgi:sugar phosphate isomerase/epimerase